MSKNIDVKQEEITSVVYYKDATGQPAVMKYVSPFDKSDKIRNGEISSARKSISTVMSLIL